MNERDYLIIETSTIVFGVCFAFILTVLGFINFLSLSYTIIFLLSTAFISFSLGIYTHMKRKIFQMEMEGYSSLKRKDGR